MFLPDVLLHGAGLHLLGAVRAGQLLSVAVHPLTVVVQPAGELEGDPALLTEDGLVLVPLQPSPPLYYVINIVFLLHCGQVWKLI